MDSAIRRSVEREFPEIAGGYHVPRFARILAVSDAPADAGMCDDFRPRFAADIEVLGPDDEPDPDIPTLYSVPLPLPTGGDEMGFYAFPGEGTKVVLCFGYGLPNKPFISTILPHGISLPNVPKGDSIWQHSATSQQRVDVEGSWSRQTHAKITDSSMDREVSSLENSERFGSHSQAVADHSSETIGGVKSVAAVGAIHLLSGGGMNSACVGDMNVATARDMNLVVAQKLSATLGELQERVLGERRSVAIKTWVGSESVNVLQVLCDTLDLVERLAGEIAAHVHGPSPAPANAAAFVADASEASALAAAMKIVTL